MASSRARFAALTVSIATLCSLAGTAGAQIADGIADCAWLRMKVKASGFELLPDTAGLGKKRAYSATCYVQLMFQAPSDGNPYGRYLGPILCPVDAANWDAVSSVTGQILADGSAVFADNELMFMNEASDVVQGFSASILRVKLDKLGAFKGATFQTLGGELIEDSTFFTTPAKMLGGYTVTGSTVPVLKVPPEAQALVSMTPCAP
jgi:hypothetical protein